MEGTHTIERCEEITEATLKRVYFELHAHRVILEGTLLKPNMVLSGTGCPVQAGVQEVAEATVRCFRRSRARGGARGRFPSPVDKVQNWRQNISTP